MWLVFSALAVFKTLLSTTALPHLPNTVTYSVLTYHSFYFTFQWLECILGYPSPAADIQTASSVYKAINNPPSLGCTFAGLAACRLLLCACNILRTDRPMRRPEGNHGTSQDQFFGKREVGRSLSYFYFNLGFSIHGTLSSRFLILAQFPNCPILHKLYTSKKR